MSVHSSYSKYTHWDFLLRIKISCFFLLERNLIPLPKSLKSSWGRNIGRRLKQSRRKKNWEKHPTTTAFETFGKISDAAIELTGTSKWQVRGVWWERVSKMDGESFRQKLVGPARTTINYDKGTAGARRAPSSRSICTRGICAKFKRAND